MNGAQAIFESLKRENVDVVFGYPGGSVLDLYDAMYKIKFPHILVRHEQGAVHAADGYARVTGKVGVCIATSGPGATNLVTGIATANMDSVPLVCFTGQVINPLIGKDAFQEADIVGITTPITKHNYLVKDVRDLPRIIKEAFFIARTGRPGPVVIDIAKDIFTTQLDYEYPKKVNLRGYSGDFTGKEEQVEAAVAAIKNAKKPLFFIGGGLTASNQSDTFRAIADRTGIPIITSLMGIGCIPSNHPSMLGMVGMHGSYAANMAVQNCDLLIAIGVRFDDRVTGKLDAYAPNAKIVHFEVDRAEINKNVYVDYPVCADLRWSLPIFGTLVRVLGNDYKEQIAEWNSYLKGLSDSHPFAYDANCDHVKQQEVIDLASQILPDDAVIVTDVGQHQMWAAQFYNSPHPRQFITSGGLGTMGYGLPASIGAKLGKPDSKVVLFSGDGGIMMNCQEISTAVDNGIDIKVIVLNNSVLGMVNQWQRMFYSERYSHSIMGGKTDFVKLAEAMGMKGCRIDTKEDLRQKLEDFLNSEGPALLEVVVPEHEDVFPMVAPGAALDNMVLGG